MPLIITTENSLQHTTRIGLSNISESVIDSIALGVSNSSASGNAKTTRLTLWIKKNRGEQLVAALQKKNLKISSTEDSEYIIVIWQSENKFNSYPAFNPATHHNTLDLKSFSDAWEIFQKFDKPNFTNEAREQFYSMLITPLTITSEENKKYKTLQGVSNIPEPVIYSIALTIASGNAKTAQLTVWIMKDTGEQLIAALKEKNLEIPSTEDPELAIVWTSSNTPNPQNTPRNTLDLKSFSDAWDIFQRHDGSCTSEARRQFYRMLEEFENSLHLDEGDAAGRSNTQNPIGIFFGVTSSSSSQTSLLSARKDMPIINKEEEINGEITRHRYNVSNSDIARFALKIENKISHSDVLFWIEIRNKSPLITELINNGHHVDSCSSGRVVYLKSSTNKDSHLKKSKSLSWQNFDELCEIIEKPESQIAAAMREEIIKIPAAVDCLSQSSSIPETRIKIENDKFSPFVMRQASDDTYQIVTFTSNNAKSCIESIYFYENGIDRQIKFVLTIYESQGTELISALKNAGYSVVSGGNHKAYLSLASSSEKNSASKKFNEENFDTVWKIMTKLLSNHLDKIALRDIRLKIEEISNLGEMRGASNSSAVQGIPTDTEKPVTLIQNRI